MSEIKNIGLLKSLLHEQQLEQLELAAKQRKEESNISFTIQSVLPNIIEIQTLQQENRSGKYANELALTKRTNEVFAKYLPNFNLQVHPVTFHPSPAMTVTPLWLEKKMLEKGIRIKQIAFDTGIDRESIADWISGKRAMSQIVKAMFYFYLIR